MRRLKRGVADPIEEKTFKGEIDLNFLDISKRIDSKILLV